jgi:hypothetical protein
MNLEKAVDSTQIAQALDLPGYMKKMLITNKVTPHFFITPFKSKSISYTLYALPTALSRIKQTTRLHGIFRAMIIFLVTGWKSSCALT